MTWAKPGAKAPYNRNDYFFHRHHTGFPPDPAPPLRPLWKDILAGVFLAAFMAVCVVVL